MAAERLRLVAVSGGKDSTAMALRLAELGEHVDAYIYTSTGDEPPELRPVLAWLDLELPRAILRLPPKWTLSGLVKEFGMLPGVGASRWCCHVLKRRPVIQYLREIRRPVEMLVGFRCDEPKRRGYRWPDDLDVKVRFPLREWSWCKDRVRAYLATLELELPPSTNCVRCPQQRLGGWWKLWRFRPAIWRSAEAQEARWGGTFRHPERDTWPASLRLLRAEFEAGRVPRGAPG